MSDQDGHGERRSSRGDGPSGRVEFDAQGNAVWARTRGAEQAVPASPAGLAVLSLEPAALAKAAPERPVPTYFDFRRGAAPAPGSFTGRAPKPAR